MPKYNTNLTSEFHVLSMLHRLGMDACLKHGNKKMVDIIVSNEDGRLVTIDVKGIAKKHDWPADNIRPPKNDKHFVLLVSYEGRIEDPTFMLSVWVNRRKKSIHSSSLIELERMFQDHLFCTRVRVFLMPGISSRKHRFPMEDLEGRIRSDGDRSLSNCL